MAPRKPSSRLYKLLFKRVMRAPLLALSSCLAATILADYLFVNQTSLQLACKLTEGITTDCAGRVVRSAAHWKRRLANCINSHGRRQLTSLALERPSSLFTALPSTSRSAFLVTRHTAVSKGGHTFCFSDTFDLLLQTTSFRQAAASVVV